MFAIVFPGQGSQVVGMASDFAEAHPEARAVLDAADEAFGGPLSTWIAEGPEERLRRTEITQPAVLAASLAMYRALESRLPSPPAFFAGHSLGEYSALVAAGALDLGDAVSLVRQRGALMQEAVPEGKGAMLAVMGLDGAEVARICDAVDGPVSAANLNSPVQTVIAGSSDAVASAREALEAAGARRVVPLEVSAPFHCELMAPARDKLTPLLAETRFRDARIPVVSNVKAEPYREADRARELLREQVCSPVRWVESVKRLADEGVTLQLEIGPGKVLSGLAARIDKKLARANVAAVGDVDTALAAVEAAS
jgi:[acyl-carrier-protein] S-malonyltransferase